MSSFPRFQPDENRQAQTVAALTRSLTPVQPLPSDGVLIARAFAFFLAFSLLVAALFGLSGFGHLSLLQKLVYLPAVMAGGLTASIAMVAGMIPGSKRRLNTAAALGIVFVGLCTVVALIFPDRHSADFVRNGTPCLRLGLLCAAISAVLAYRMLRKGYASSPLLFSLAVGCFCGLTGITVLALHCPRLEAPHILVWHLSTMLISGAVAAALTYLRLDVARSRSPNQLR